MRLPAVLASAAVIFAAGVALAPSKGPTYLYLAAFLAGPAAVCGWLCIRRPLIALVTAYIALAPVDFLLVASAGVSISRLIGMAAVGVTPLTLLMRGANTRLPRALIWWLIAAAWMMASVVWAGDQPKAIERLSSTLLPIAVMTIVALIPADRLDLRVMLGAVVGVGAVLCLYGITHPSHQGAISRTGRLVVSSGNASIDPNGFAFALVTPLAIAIAAAVNPGDMRRRIAGLALAPLFIAAILMTESRGGLFGLLVVLTWVAVRTRHRIFGYALLGLGVLATTLYGGAWERLFSDSAANANGAGRLPIWRVGFEAFREHWLIGNGYGTFSDAYNQAYLIVPHHEYIGWSREAHNIVLAVFVELGVFGGALVLYAWWRQFRELSTSIASDDPDAWMRLAMEAAVLGVFVTGLFLDILVLKPTWVAPILIIAIANVRMRERLTNAARRAAAHVVAVARA